ncbi:RNA polymerase sigma24 factor [Sphaerisporangium krabiense]|uniref:RNA polymerase sigma-70 factor (Sigma-E family) n=1 Tax=Sphaerisporangium krabiense TaxID=763782 RepID=A0A7W8ZAW1_9ACTN|nr:sigma-70 family RNA polymerase sigma factor [Sphaerisporangium krabiense]MBB5630515.1 RNA polymerase sigma-70 factor (sigma-E family) [Sphaerisporangium krabiense]GII62531.1 RNA polymerase sigma24 factor [Sphaerisporangium krabiense]
MTRIPTASRERPAFADIFAAHYPAMVRLAGLLGADDPEDIAQEAFARLHRRRGRLRDDAASVPYLRAIVCNLTRNRVRHLRIARLRRPEPPTPAISGEQAFLIAERHRDLLAAVDGLPRRQREAVVLRYWLDLSEREIADAMGVTPGSVKSHTSRAIAALGRALEEKNDD